MNSTARSRDSTDDPLANTICVAGNGRSGTTIFFKVLGTHPELGWVSNFVEKAPAYPGISVLSRFYPLAIRLGPQSRISRYIPRPGESVNSIRECSDGLFWSRREVVEEEMTEEVVRSVRDYHAKVLRYHGRNRLATKHTGFPRFRFWRAVFPKARFIQIIRDGRAVVSSVMRVPWRNDSLEDRRWGPIPEEYVEEYESSGRRSVVLAAITWKQLLDLYEEEAARLPDDVPYKQVRYSDFTADPMSVMQDVAEFAGLPESHEFEKSVSRFRIHDADTGWKTRLDPEDLKHIERVIGDHLAKYGFS